MLSREVITSFERGRKFCRRGQRFRIELDLLRKRRGREQQLLLRVLRVWSSLNSPNKRVKPMPNMKVFAPLSIDYLLVITTF